MAKKNNQQEKQRKSVQRKRIFRMRNIRWEDEMKKNKFFPVKRLFFTEPMWHLFEQHRIVWLQLHDAASTGSIIFIHCTKKKSINNVKLKDACSLKEKLWQT